MEASEMTIGRWVRVPYKGPALVVKAPPPEEVHVWACQLLKGGELLYPFAEACEPWTPRAGEWCRLTAAGVEAAAGWDSAYREEASRGVLVTRASADYLEWKGALGVSGAYTNRFEPCLQPAAPSLPENAGQHESPWVPKVGERVRYKDAPSPTGMVVEVTGRGVLWRLDDGSSLLSRANTLAFVAPLVAFPPPSAADLQRAGEVFVAGIPKTRCPICRGPATELLVSVQCHAEVCVPWVEPEPAVSEKWTGPNRAKLYTEPSAGSERTFYASGRGHAAAHPIRETAIEMWRAKVGQGGRR